MNDIKIQPTGQLTTDNSEYVKLVSLISKLWDEAKAKATIAVKYASLTTTLLLALFWEQRKTNC